MPYITNAARALTHELTKYATQRVLVLGFIHGRHLAAVTDEELAAIDSQAIAKDLLSAYLRQIAIDGGIVL